MGPLYGVI